MDVPRLNDVLHHPPAVLLILTLLAVSGFAGVTRLSRKFHHHEGDVARALFNSGRDQINKGNPQSALADFRAALNYDRDNYDYQLGLARALAAGANVEEAHAYLVTLWDRSPQDGEVNYQLAQLAVRRNSPDEAVRFYHNAIYGIWRSDPDTNRRRARFALVDLLLAQQRPAEAQAELIAMSAALAPDPALHLRVAAEFERIGDYEHALAQYRRAVSLDRKNPAALAGAGKAAFQLAQYRLAQRYLEQALSLDPGDSEVARRLSLVRLIQQNDPFHSRLSDRERASRVSEAFHQLHARLDACAQQHGQTLAPPPPPDSPLRPWLDQWRALEPAVRKLPRSYNAETVDSVMDLVARVEGQAGAYCGSPSDLDTALLLVAQNRESRER